MGSSFELSAEVRLDRFPVPLPQAGATTVRDELDSEHGGGSKFHRSHAQSLRESRGDSGRWARFSLLVLVEGLSRNDVAHLCGQILKGQAPSESKLAETIHLDIHSQYGISCQVHRKEIESKSTARR